MRRKLTENDMPCIMGILNATPDSFSDGIPDFYEDSDVTQKLLEEKLEKMMYSNILGTGMAQDRKNTKNSCPKYRNLCVC